MILCDCWNILGFCRILKGYGDFVCIVVCFLGGIQYIFV